MISVEEALAKILADIKLLEPETMPILESLGLVLAEDVYSDLNIPPMNNSAMDGYAVHAADTRGATVYYARMLKVVGTVPAGSVSELKIAPGTAVRIMTGAAIPEGADAVIKFESTDEQQRSKDTAEIGILSEAVPGDNIRPAGDDIARGTMVLTKGTVINPAHIGVFASLGKERVSVVRRPKIAILATGDELTELGKTPAPGKLYNSNSYSLAAEVIQYGGIPQVLGIALDSEDSLTAKIRQGLAFDMLISTGGVSVGDYDLVKDVLAKQGNISFWSVRMRPGKPIAFGTFAAAGRVIPHLGLPGNPVAAMVTFEMFARPCILKMLGKTKYDKPSVEAILEDRVKNEDGRRVFARAVVEKREGQYFAHTTGPQGSHILTSMSSANGLVVIPEDKQAAEPGDKVKVIMLNWNCEEI